MIPRPLSLYRVMHFEKFTLGEKGLAKKVWAGVLHWMAGSLHEYLISITHYSVQCIFSHMHNVNLSHRKFCVSGAVLYLDNCHARRNSSRT